MSNHRYHRLKFRTCAGIACRTLAVGLLLASSSCAYQYVDDQGVRHVVGLSHVQTKPLGDTSLEGTVSQVSVLGLSVLRLPETTGAAVGYTRNFSVEIFSDNAAGVFDLDTREPTTFQFHRINQCKEAL